MNTIGIITAIIALLGGVAIGSNLPANNSSAIEETGNQNQEHSLYDNPSAQDFISMRPSIASLPSELLSQEEIDGLLLMREEEKLARDVYQTLYEQWGLRIFTNIAQSEQTHTEAIRDLLEKYNLTDPVTDDTIGVFKNETLQALYTNLVAQGQTSDVAALRVGATIEDLDIKDLQDLLNKTDNQDIALIYENLMRGSRNHLRSFTKQLTMRTETYEPQYISIEDYQAIISGSQETGIGEQSDNSGVSSGKNTHSGRGWGERGW